MGIKESISLRKIKISLLILIIFSFMALTILSRSLAYEVPHNEEFPEQLQTSNSEVLVDKVYNFTTVRDYVIFRDNIFFVKLFIYYISFEIVTPHTCDMNISLWDPDGDLYHIYHKGPLNQEIYTIYIIKAH
jgi:hypothetical protein